MGDRTPSSTGIEIDGRGEGGTRGESERLAATGGLRLRQSIGRIGYLGGLDLRAGSESGFRWEADAHALGFGARSGTWQLGLTGAIGARGIDGTTTVRVPAELDVEGSLGPMRLLSRVALGWRLNHGGPGTSVLRIADEANALLGLRLGRDVHYWSDVHAGGGPFIAATYSRRDGYDLVGVALGLELWGAN